MARNRRPPRDPVNVCLSLGYTLLHVEAVRAVALAGLDPYIGFLHDLHHGRESLACDLAELERARVDEWTFYAFRDRILRAEYFRSAENGCILGKAGRRAFYGGFQEVSETASRRLRHWAYAVVRLLNKNSEEKLFAEPVLIPEQSGLSEAFTRLFGSLLVFVYHCFDRIVINGYLNGLSRPEQVVHFVREVLGIPVVSKEVLSRRTNDYQGWVEAGFENIPGSRNVL
jgi:hypothetical protein